MFCNLLAKKIVLELVKLVTAPETKENDESKDATPELHQLMTLDQFCLGILDKQAMDLMKVQNTSKKI